MMKTNDMKDEPIEKIPVHPYFVSGGMTCHVVVGTDVLHAIDPTLKHENVRRQLGNWTKTLGLNKRLDTTLKSGNKPVALDLNDYNCLCNYLLENSRNWKPKVKEWLQSEQAKALEENLKVMPPSVLTNDLREADQYIRKELHGIKRPMTGPIFEGIQHFIQKIYRWNLTIVYFYLVNSDSKEIQKGDWIVLTDSNMCPNAQKEVHPMYYHVSRRGICLRCIPLNNSASSTRWGTCGEDYHSIVQAMDMCMPTQKKPLMDIVFPYQDPLLDEQKVKKYQDALEKLSTMKNNTNQSIIYVKERTLKRKMEDAKRARYEYEHRHKKSILEMKEKERRRAKEEARKKQKTNRFSSLLESMNVKESPFVVDLRRLDIELGLEEGKDQKQISFDQMKEESLLVESLKRKH